ncbi:uncharacterized protein L969DRAFT_88991 [Mixia osmundae IAM 14324]|uniref:BAR domain-containing protein n=1 Tax=Mixia osmundae (strain CBS 9802 / IAM 14324 / JCM 22182 / KY 12970) TaxID=764103 RepID=G7E7Y9_MIXOS|nr:uncharacterized protein L969DRAFT_88991 [Mixia osmundae IAM 14324]KEI38548.1 hypothetical protein L969DRAFT_88991 [Mixia osmundae IAM 14324]GAA98949.1 hypothetical protein E5Q_05637 [Mixia osmundae IAM 14324]
MKGLGKAIVRTPHMLTSKVGMASKSSDPEFDDLNRRFTVVEGNATKLLKDAEAYRSAAASLIDSAGNFSGNFAELFQPIGDEYGLDAKYPDAVDTIKNISSYRGDMAALKEAIQPELELIDARIIIPVKEYIELIKKARKAITKRDHKLIDYDRHNNAYVKARDKKEKSLKEEQNLFKLEQNHEQASQEYDYQNTLLKTELPRFIEISLAFIKPLFESLYFMQLNIFYTMHESLEAYTSGKIEHVSDVEHAYTAKLGDAGEKVAELSIIRRVGSTQMLLAQHRGGAGAGSSLSPSRSSTLASASSTTSPTRPYGAKPVSPGLNRATSGTYSAPPPYTGGAVAAAGNGVAKRPPPPPPPKPGARVTYCTALYDFTAQAAGDLSFSAGDRIELVERTASTEDWWKGKLNGQSGSFPGNYVEIAQ